MKIQSIAQQHASGKWRRRRRGWNSTTSFSAGQVKFQLKKVLCMGVAVGNVAMTPDELRRRLMPQCHCH